MRVVTPGRIVIWEVATGRKLHQLDRTAAPRESVEDYRRGVAFSPDLARVAFCAKAGTTLGLQVWDIAGGKKLWDFEARDQSFQFSADSKFLIVGSENEPIQLMDADTGKLVRGFVGHDGGGRHVAGVDPTGKYVASARGSFGPAGGIVRMWDMAGGKELTGSDGHVDAVTLARATPDGKWVVTSGRDGTLRLWESATGRLVRSMTGFKGETAAIAATGRLAAMDGQGKMHLLDIPEFQPSPLPGNQHFAPTHFTLSPDGTMLAVSMWPPPDNPVRKSKECLFDVQSGKVLANLNEAFSGRMAFTADSQVLATVSNNIKLWQSNTGKKLMAFRAPFVEIDQAQSDGDECTTFWDVAFSTDDRWLAITRTYHPGEWNVDKLSVLEVATGQLVVEVAGQSFGEAAIAFTPDSLTLVIGGRGAKFWDLSNGQLLGSTQGQSGSVTSVAFSPDGNRLLTGSSDGTVLIWDAAALPRAKTPVARKLGPAELAALWEDLAGMDGRKAFQAIVAMRAGGKDSIDFLRPRLQPVKSLTQEELNRLVADLENPSYTVRAKAFAALENQGELAENTLRKALKDNVTPEMRQRLKLLLAKAETFTPPPSDLRKLRALAVLEYIGDAEACKVIETLAAGSIEARLTWEARAALDRLARRAKAAS
jgi:WD40 repeat protein